MTATANGAPLGEPLVVGPGATETTSTADLSQFEDQTITVQVLVDGDVVATYDADARLRAAAVPEVSGRRPGMPASERDRDPLQYGDPESTVVFTILVDGKVVQQTAPLFGGDTTTIVGDLTPYEDQTVTIELRANGEVLGSRTLAVNCQPAPGPGPGAGGCRPRWRQPLRAGRPSRVDDMAVLPGDRRGVQRRNWSPSGWPSSSVERS